MAVKIPQLDKAHFLVFLSRLCGGEGYELDPTMDGGFLSRLCGGEVY